MAQPTWDSVAPYIAQVFSLTGRVERADCLDLAFARGAPDEVVDALDALGSRLFPNPEAAREFLTQRGYIAP